MKDSLEYFGIDPQDPDCGMKMYLASLKLVEELLAPFTDLKDPLEDWAALGLSEDEVLEFLTAVSAVLAISLSDDRLTMLAQTAELSPALFRTWKKEVIGTLIQKIVLLHLGIRYKQLHQLDLPNLDFLKES